MNFCIRIVIIIVLASLAFYLFYLGYSEKDTDYNNTYSRAVATITNKIVESADIIDKNDQLLHVHNKKFRIKIMYTYKVDDQTYNSYFYNDGKKDDVLDAEEYMQTAKVYDYIKRITVFYQNDNPRKSYVNLDKIRENKTKLYYFMGGVVILAIPFVLFV